MFRNVLIVGFVLVLTFGVFVRTVNHDFIIWDDDRNIYENAYISRFSTDGIPHFWKNSFEGLYIPLTYTVWSLLAYNAGEKVNLGAGPTPIVSAAKFHLANVFLHLGSVSLVIFLFYLILGRRDLFAAAAGAALFALHPIQVESVAWATGMKDVLSTFLALISVLLYLSYSRALRKKRPAVAWSLYALAFLIYVVALLAKPQLVIIPPIIAILLWSREENGFVPLPDRSAKNSERRWDHWDSLMVLAIVSLVFFRCVLRWKDQSFLLLLDVSLIALAAVPAAILWLRRKAAKKRVASLFGDVVWLVPFFLAAFFFVRLTMIVQPDQDEIFPFVHPTPLQRPFVALDALTFYLMKLVYPFMLTVDYGRTPAKALEYALNYPVWIVPLVAGAFLVRIKSHRRYYFSAFAIALVAILPNLGFIPFGFQGQSTVADRYVYISMIGVGLAVATLLTFTENRIPRYLVLGVLPVLAALSFNQVRRWKNSEVLFNYAIEVNPRSVASTYNLGLTYSKENRHIMAMEYYQRTLKIRDDFGRPWNNMGYVLNDQRRYKEAIPYFEKAIELNPEYAGSYSNLGISYDNLGEHDKAIELYDQALEREPLNPPVFINLGLAHMKKGEFERALYYFKKGARMQPTLYHPYSGMGDIYFKLKDYPKAIANYQNLVNLQPEHPLNWRALAKSFAHNGQFDQAVKAAAKGVEKAKASPTIEGQVLRLLEREHAAYLEGRIEGEGDIGDSK